jgi:hypothetical protein
MEIGGQTRLNKTLTSLTKNEVMDEMKYILINLTDKAKQIRLNLEQVLEH